ncbi:phospholipase D [Saccharomycopsis crataegensis]|uniref:Phospholipase D1 n=1 Tax=Saccharomycopsis crataegensis TaxID=43959 RepID=A0AAV5QH79_9ASCO|nr:phospholipase D [Saccharomycopsis crataegensis]
MVDGPFSQTDCSSNRNDENVDTIDNQHQHQQPQLEPHKPMDEAEVVPNKFSISELVNDANDIEEHSTPKETDPVSSSPNDGNGGGGDSRFKKLMKKTKDGRMLSPLVINSSFSSKNSNKNDDSVYNVDTPVDPQAPASPQSPNGKSLFFSPQSIHTNLGSTSKKFKSKTPTTPVIKSFFSMDRDGQNSPDGGVGLGVTSGNNNNNDQEISNGDGDVNWLKRLSKFNHSEQNFNDWKSNFFSFNKNKAQQSQQQSAKNMKKPQKPTKKEILSESDKLARNRANFLIESLFLGYTASNLVSSMFLLDEQDTRRAPLLAHLVGIRIRDITDSYYGSSRHHHRYHLHHGRGNDIENDLGNTTADQIIETVAGDAINSSPNDDSNTDNGEHGANFKNPPIKRRKFRLEMEYGVGENRAKWTLIRSYKEIASFVTKLKLISNATLNLKKGSRLNLPYFPKLRKVSNNIGGTNRNMCSFDSDTDSSSSSDEDDEGEYEVIDLSHSIGGTRAEIERPRSRSSYQSDLASSKQEDPEPINPLARTSTRGSVASQVQNLMSRITSSSQRGAEKKKHLVFNGDPHSQEEYTKRLEHYFKKLFLELSLRPQSNKLFQFFELSPIGVLLSNENGYRGKQGYLLIATSAKKQGWRVGHLKASDLGAMIKRHTMKWFCVSESYILYVADINSTTILDVFLVDEFFQMKYSGEKKSGAAKINELVSDNEESDDDSDEEDEEQMLDEEDVKHPKRITNRTTPHLNITVENKERKLKMVATSDHEMNLWVRSIQIMLSKTEWAQPKRFNSFAPVRQNCFAQWFVDARDYWWAASSAIEMAKDVIFIHDWWLSPELYLRRPANGNQEWRIDRLLKRKAEQGVKIFVIIYRNIGEFVVIDSSWTKHSLMDLHENIRVLRSPNQFLQNTFFWAHHEKLLIIDHTIAFLGGIDLCYGRYDTPDHVLVDDAPTAFGDPNGAASKNTRYQNFPGKDYSNPRVKDFFELDKPYESMYDRQKTPRMPWHDVHMVNAGQIARDLSRHFVQRWNYLIRQKRPSRPTPLLTPPTNMTQKEIDEMGFKGSCEVQLLRSSGYWSLGLKEVEHSIQNAYLKLIETSEHFVYIENQFFVTACAWDNVVIENRIGDALVDRIIRAHNEGKVWRAVIVIPLMPGFEAQVDEPEGSSVRVIMQCQYMSISRGSTSIFAKLKKVGIDPDNYIQFFSLRKWGRIGEYGKLVSEQLYIHAKTMVVDDRVAIIGSANINERSMRGSRDSEICAVIRDTETVKTTMNGKPYLAGKFAHTLRMRLMREHLGVDVDVLEMVERKFDEIEKIVKSNFDKGLRNENVTGNFNNDANAMRSAMVELASREVLNLSDGTNKWKKFRRSTGQDPANHYFDEDGDVDSALSKLDSPLYKSFNSRAWVENAGLRDKKQLSSDPRIKNNLEHKADVAGKGDNLDSKAYGKWKLNARQTLKKWALQSSDNKKFKSVFIPNLDSVKEFLGNDEEFVEISAGLLSKEHEEILAQRDQERWEMLKRVAYLQRLGIKYEIELKDENSKRSKMGLKTKVSPFTSPEANSSLNGGATGIPNDPKEILSKFNFDAAGHTGVLSSSLVDGHPVTSCDLLSDDKKTAEDTKVNGDNINIPDTEKTNNSNNKSDQNGTSGATAESTANSDIPITTLNDDEINHLFSNSLKIGKSRFIDPYGFSDPLDEEFYEDMWFENAYRNTKIFRLVFHCQPDDTVATWNEYKEAHKLMTAFSIAQDYEIAAIKEQGYDLTTGHDEDEDLDEKMEDDEFQRPALYSHRTSRSVRIEDLNREAIGVLGRPPEEIKIDVNSSSQNPQQQSNSPQPPRLQKINKSFKKFSNLRKGSLSDGMAADSIMDNLPIQEENENSSGHHSDSVSLHTTASKLKDEDPKNIGSPVTFGDTLKDISTNEKSSITPEQFHHCDGDKLNFLTPSVQNHNNKSVSKSSSFHDQSTYNASTRGAVSLIYGSSSPVKGTGLIGRKRTGTFSNRRHKHLGHRDLIFDKETADKILSNITGHLVLFPVNWLAKELEGNNWFTNSDRLPPIEIYD